MLVGDNSYSDFEEFKNKPLSKYEKFNKLILKIAGTIIEREKNKIRLQMEDLEDPRGIERLFSDNEYLLYYGGNPVRYNRQGQMVVYRPGGSCEGFTLDPWNLLLNSHMKIDYKKWVLPQIEYMAGKWPSYEVISCFLLIQIPIGFLIMTN